MIGVDALYEDGRSSTSLSRDGLLQMEWSPSSNVEKFSVSVSPERSRGGAFGIIMRTSNVSKLAIESCIDRRVASEVEHHECVYVRLFPSEEKTVISCSIEKLRSSVNTSVWLGSIANGSLEEYSVSWMEPRKDGVVCTAIPMRMMHHKTRDTNSKIVLNPLVKLPTIALVALKNVESQLSIEGLLSASAPTFHIVSNFGSSDRVSRQTSASAGSSMVAHLVRPRALQAIAASASEPILWSLTISSVAPSDSSNGGGGGSLASLSSSRRLSSAAGGEESSTASRISSSLEEAQKVADAVASATSNISSLFSSSIGSSSSRGTLSSSQGGDDDGGTSGWVTFFIIVIIISLASLGYYAWKKWKESDIKFKDMEDKSVKLEKEVSEIKSTVSSLR